MKIQSKEQLESAGNQATQAVAQPGSSTHALVIEKTSQPTVSLERNLIKEQQDKLEVFAYAFATKLAAYKQRMQTLKQSVEALDQAQTVTLTGLLKNALPAMTSLSLSSSAEIASDAIDHRSLCYAWDELNTLNTSLEQTVDEAAKTRLQFTIAQKTVQLVENMNDAIAHVINDILDVSDETAHACRMSSTQLVDYLSVMALPNEMSLAMDKEASLKCKAYVSPFTKTLYQGVAESVTEAWIAAKNSVKSYSGAGFNHLRAVAYSFSPSPRPNQEIAKDAVQSEEAEKEAASSLRSTSASLTN